MARVRTILNSKDPHFASRSRVRGWGGGAVAAFTLVELLVVIGLIAILAVTSLPAIRALTQSNTVAAAHRQLLDDLALARHMAISGRRKVYVVFVPPTMRLHYTAIQSDRTLPPDERQRQLRAFTNLFNAQFVGYALFSQRTVGDQPGQQSPRYLGIWHTLPEGLVLDTNRFVDLQVDFPQGRAFDWKATLPEARPLPYATFPFPTETSALLRLPYVAFDSKGRLFFQLKGGYNADRPDFNPDLVLPLRRGNVLFAKMANGDYALSTPPEVIYTAQTNTWVRLNWLTGRARVEGMEVK